jgi:alanine-synthesizing transaminase
MFSTRTPRALNPNRISERIAEKRATGVELLDLTESNPTRAGFDYPSREILEALTSPNGLEYAPDPKGLLVARNAVREYYRDRGVDVSPERIVLTASTSEAYGLLFKLLAGPGDRILVPTPSYPLFEHLARAESVEPIPYPLVFDGRWSIDFEELGAELDERTRAVVLVSPNNPTGSCLRRRELDELLETCRERGVGIICDEVFADFATGRDPDRVATIAGESRALTFALSGLSKVAALPQLKLGWIVVGGPASIVEEAISRLEFLADLYLSVGTPVQWALPRLLALSPILRGQIWDRVASNRAYLERRASGTSVCRVLPSDGGWYAVVRIPRVLDEEDLIIDLIERFGLVVQPGYFFDFASEGWIIVSLITHAETFERGVALLVDYLDTWRG